MILRKPENSLSLYLNVLPVKQLPIQFRTFNRGKRAASCAIARNVTHNGVRDYAAVVTSMQSCCLVASWTPMIARQVGRIAPMVAISWRYRDVLQTVSTDLFVHYVVKSLDFIIPHHLCFFRKALEHQRVVVRDSFPEIPPRELSRPCRTTATVTLMPDASVRAGRAG